jgi:integrase
LRKAAGRRLAEAGATAHEIMAILGHRSLREVQRYTSDADQRRNAIAAMKKFVGTEVERKVSSTTK